MDEWCLHPEVPSTLHMYTCVWDFISNIVRRLCMELKLK